MGLFEKVYGPHVSKYYLFLCGAGTLLLFLFPESVYKMVFLSSAGVGFLGLGWELFSGEIRDSIENSRKDIFSQVKDLGKTISSQVEELGEQIQGLRTEIITLGKGISQTADKTENLGEEIRLLREQVEALNEDA
jgi:septal ring factor EnvC (AmiA/AmiB activator)